MILNGIAAALLIWGAVYFLGHQAEPWRNFGWQLFAVALIIGGITPSMTELLPDWMVLQEPNLFKARGFAPFYRRLFIIWGIIIFVLSWLFPLSITKPK